MRKPFKQNSRRRGLRRHAAICTALALLLAGCGGGTEDGAAAGDADADSDEDSGPDDSDEAETDGEDDGQTDGEDDGETYEIMFANFLGENAAQILAMRWWADEVEQRTNGRVTVEFFHSGSLLDAGDTLPGIGDGRAQMGHVAHFYHPGELPLSALSEVPFMVQNPQIQARAFNDLYANNADFRAEWEAMGVHVLHFNPSGVLILGSPDPITDPSELGGLQVRSVGYAAEALSVQGANPIPLEAPEIYESLQRGLIDAYSSFPFEVITAFQLQEVAPYVADPGFGNYLLTAAPINLELWESMPSNIQAILTEVSEELLDYAVWEIYADVEDAVCDAIQDEGGSVVVFDDGAVDAWDQEIGDRFIDEWIDRVGGDGSPADEFLSQYRAALDTYASDADFESGVRRCAER